mgnify:CR=1 FL=1
MRILLAEDERSLSRAVTALLERNHYAVDVVYDGAEALDYLEGGNYDALILDIMMPKVDGLEVLRRLRERGNAIPVLMLTAKGEVEDKVLGLDSGANDYLTKPFATEELLHEMRMRGIYLSGSSACEKGARSHVIRAMGIEGPRADSVVRIGLGKKNTREEVTVLVETLNELIKRGK